MNIDIDLHGYVHIKEKAFQLDMITKVWDDKEVFKSVVHGVGFFEFEDLKDKLKENTEIIEEGKH